MFGIAAKLDRHSIAAEVEKIRPKSMPQVGWGRKRAVPTGFARSLRNS
jgi:hypothetical protein